MQVSFFVVPLPMQTKRYFKMKKLKTTNYVKTLSVVIPRNNGTQAGINALQASLLRGIK